MSTHVVARASELPPGGSKIVHVAGRSIGVFNIKGSYYALRNRCPHMGAPLCLGSIQGTLEPSAPGQYLYGHEDRILRCPWHGWEFDVTTGNSVFNPNQTRVKAYDVTVEAFDVSVHDGLVLLHL
jgi:nitrite reductase/ring-hydroxylating ferredoxin subunit